VGFSASIRPSPVYCTFWICYKCILVSLSICYRVIPANFSTDQSSDWSSAVTSQFNPLVISHDILCTLFPSSCGVGEMSREGMGEICFTSGNSVEPCCQGLKYYIPNSFSKNVELFACSVTCITFVTFEKLYNNIKKLDSYSFCSHTETLLADILRVYCLRTHF
jgi:hypothetical protein